MRLDAGPNGRILRVGEGRWGAQLGRFGWARWLPTFGINAGPVFVRFSVRRPSARFWSLVVHTTPGETGTGPLRLYVIWRDFRTELLRVRWPFPSGEES